MQQNRIQNLDISMYSTYFFLFIYFFFLAFLQYLTKKQLTVVMTDKVAGTN